MDIRWTCDETKFQQIILTNGIYREELSQVSNYMWSLEISNYCIPRQYQVKVQTPIDDVRFSEDGVEAELIETVKYSNYLWRFNLVRDSGDLNLNCRTTIFSGTDVSVKSFVFDDGLKSYPFGTLDTTKLVDFKVDIEFRIATWSYRLEMTGLGPIPTYLKHTPKPTVVSKLDGLSKDLSDLFEKEHDADIFFKCGSVVIKGHKNILSARSPVLKNLLKADNSDDDIVIERRELEITEIDPVVFRALLTFLYAGKVNIDSKDLAVKLAAAAARFQVPDLKEEIHKLFKLKD